MRSKSAPGDSVRISDNLFKSVPLGQLLSYILLGLVFMSHIVVDKKYPIQDPINWQLLFQIVSIVSIISFNALWATFNGDFKGWWNYAEE